MNGFKILVPVDFSDSSAVVLRYALTIAHSKPSAAITLFHVDPQVLPYYDERSGGLEPARWFTHLRLCCVKRAASIDVPIDEMVVYGDPATEIVIAAKCESYDLIVMGTHGHTGIQRLLIGSVAEAVMRDAPCPVLFVRFGNEPTEESSDAETNNLALDAD